MGCDGHAFFICLCKDPNDESDEEEGAFSPSKKVTGMWFHRSVDFYQTDSENVVTKAVDIFEAIEKGDIDKVVDICGKNVIDVNKINKGGLTPLFWYA